MWKGSKSDKTQEILMWQNSKTLIKLKDATGCFSTISKNLNCDKNKDLKLGQN